jgi:hypothetical protein
VRVQGTRIDSLAAHDFGGVRRLIHMKHVARPAERPLETGQVRTEQILANVIDGDQDVRIPVRHEIVSQPGGVHTAADDCRIGASTG